jgi:hypothetical protein
MTKVEVNLSIMVSFHNKDFMLNDPELVLNEASTHVLMFFQHKANFSVLSKPYVKLILCMCVCKSGCMEY